MYILIIRRPRQPASKAKARYVFRPPARHTGVLDIYRYTLARRYAGALVYYLARRYAGVRVTSFFIIISMNKFCPRRRRLMFVG